MTTASAVESGLPLYLGLDGIALQSGKMFFGVANKNPVTNPISVFWDQACTQPAAQPVTIANGRTVRSDGTPSRVWIQGDFSRLIQDALGRQVSFDQSQAALVLPFSQAGTGAVSRGAQDKMRDIVSVMDFGAIADGTIHLLSERYATLAAAQVDYPFVTALTQSIDWAAFTAAINSLADAVNYSRGGTVYAPRGRYYLSDTIDIDRRVTITGDGDSAVSGGIFYPPTILLCAANIHGIRVRSTFDSPGSKSGAYTSIRNLVLTPYASAGATGHGIWSSARVFVENVQIVGFAQNGVNIVASSGTTGNANLFSLINVSSISCGGKGFFISGTDANAGLIQKCSAESCVGEGFYDSSFLGNTYVACHGSLNKIGSAPNYVDYKSTDVNAKNVYIGCYTESGLNELIRPCTVLGGTLAGSAGHLSTSTANVFGGDSYRAPLKHYNEASYISLGVSRPYFTPGGNDLLKTVYGFGFETLNTYLVKYTDPGGGNPKVYHYEMNAAVNVMSLPADTSARKVAPFYANGINYGVPAAYTSHSSGVSPPASGTWAIGDVVWNSSPAAGTFAGWICTTAGTPGTWKTFAPITP